MSRWVVSYFVSRPGHGTVMRATIHVDGCGTLNQARRQEEDPPPRVKRPSIVEEGKYLEAAARSPMAEPVEHKCCSVLQPTLDASHGDQREETHVQQPTRPRS